MGCVPKWNAAHLRLESLVFQHVIDTCRAVLLLPDYFAVEDAFEA